MTNNAQAEIYPYNFPSSYPTEEGMETISKVMEEVEEIFENSPMNAEQRTQSDIKSGITYGASYEGSENEVWRNYHFHRNFIEGFPIADFRFQVSSKGNYSGCVPSLEYELKIRKVLEKYKTHTTENSLD